MCRDLAPENANATYRWLSQKSFHVQLCLELAVFAKPICVMDPTLIGK